MESYKNLKIYKEATKSFKRSIENYISTNKPSNEQMYYQLELYKYTHLDKKEARRKNPLAAMIILGVVLLCLVATNNPNTSKEVAIAAVILMVALTVVYFSGLVNDSKIQIRKIRKKLAEYPEIPEFKGTEK